MQIVDLTLGESITLGPGIHLTVVDISRGRARLGIAADPRIPVRRGELAAEGARAGEARRGAREDR